MISTITPFYQSLASFRPSLLVLAIAASSAVHAAEKLPSTTLEEVTVTAEFRDALLMKSAGSTSVLEAATLQQRDAQHLEDVLSAAPNISWSNGASRSRFIQIRGVGDLEQYAEPKYYPSVGVVVDDLELGTSSAAGLLYDVDQVEVLRGPQGTRFGATGHAGMLKVRTNAPSDEFEGHIDAGVGNYDSYETGAVVSGPLSDSLKGRIAVHQYRSDGYMDNERLGRDDTAAFDETTARAKLNWQATETSQYDLSVLSVNTDNGYDAFTYDNSHNSQADQPGQDQQRLLATTLKGQWQLNGKQTLEATVTNSNSDSAYGYDVDWGSQELCVTYSCVLGGGIDTAQELFDRENRQSTVDLRLLGGDLKTDRWDYVVGLYRNQTDERLDYAYPSLWYGDYASRSNYETERSAVYSELRFAMTDALTLKAGARAERFNDDYRDSNSLNHDNNDTLWNGELGAEYQLTDNTLAYATLAQANKPGGTNVAASSQQGVMSPNFQTFMADKLTFDKETLLSEEIGIKSSLLDDRLSLRAALFTAKRKNAQLENWMWDSNAGLWIGYLDTGSDARNYGAEIESRFALTETLQVFANLGWLETRVNDITAFDLDLSDFVSKNNRDQSKSPQWQYTTGIDSQLTEQLSAHLEVEGRDSSYYGYYHDGKLDGYNLLNGNLTWQQQQWRVNLWVRNILDKEYATHAIYAAADPRDDFGAWANGTYEQLGAPRTFGINLSYQL